MEKENKGCLFPLLGWSVLIGVAFFEITLFFSISNTGDGGFWMNLILLGFVNFIAIMLWMYFFSFISEMGTVIMVLYLLATLAFVWFVPLAIIFKW